MADPAVLLIPGTPLLITGVDPDEPPQMQEVRSAIRSALASAPAWTVPAPGASVPSLVSLGGHGLALGARVHSDEPMGAGGCHSTGTIQPSDLLRGEGLRDAVSALDDASARVASRVPTGVLVAVLVGLEAGVDIRVVAAADRQSVVRACRGPLLVPFDFSGAAHPDAPLAPRAGATAFDEELETALTGRVDQAQIARLHRRADEQAAWIEMVASLDLAHAQGSGLAAADVHHVRYRVFALEPAASRREPCVGDRRDPAFAGLL